MYDLGRLVWVKDQQFVGRICERYFVTTNDRRHAHYIVEEVKQRWIEADPPRPGMYRRVIRRWVPTGYDYLTGPSNLRAADFQCEDCDRWLPSSSDGGHPEAAVCFLCMQFYTYVSGPRGWRPMARIPGPLWPVGDTEESAPTGKEMGSYG